MALSKKFPISPKNPHRICWGCDKYCSSDSLACTGTDLELIRRSGLPRGVVVRRYAVCQDGYIVYSADPSVTVLFAASL